MSRFGYDGDETWNEGRQAMWDHSQQQALRSKRGLKMLREVEVALSALPGKRLVSGVLANQQGEVCAVGAWAKARLESGNTLQAYGKEVQSLERLAELDEYQEGNAWDTAEFGRANGLGLCIAWVLAYQNDETAERFTPEQRYEHVLGWVRQQIAANPHAQAEKAVTL